MDFDGFMLLIQRDYEKFEVWEKDAKKHSLEELRENYNYWKDHFKEALRNTGIWIKTRKIKKSQHSWEK